jgi:hypothetical protein
MAFEISSILTSATQLLAVLIFIIILEPLFSLLNFLILLAVLTYMARLFTKQLQIQLELQTERDGKKARPQRRYGTRIRAAENGALAAGVGLIIFFGTRLQNGSLTSTSRSLMRYARAKAGQTSRAEDDE